MRPLSIAILAVAAFTSTMTIATTNADAVVCAAGVYRAGCAGPRGSRRCQAAAGRRLSLCRCERRSRSPMRISAMRTTPHPTNRLPPEASCGWSLVASPDLG